MTHQPQWEQTESGSILDLRLTAKQDGTVSMKGISHNISEEPFKQDFDTAEDACGFLAEQIQQTTGR